MKRTFLLLLCLLPALAAVRAQAPSGLNPQAPLEDDLGRALGFLLGQRITLNRVKAEFPDMASRARQAEAEFNLSFGTAETGIRNALQRMLGDEYPKFVAQAESRLQTALASRPVTRETAGSFLAEVESRAKGSLPSPLLETLLTYEFMGRPAEEFARGYKRVFRTAGHPKARGVDFQISYPASWRPGEGERPNVIQKFVSENGRGLEMVMLMVKDLPTPGYKVARADLEALFSEKELRGMVPAGGRLIAAKPIVLDGQKGGMVVFEQTLQRLAVSMTVRGVHFVTVRSGKMVSVQCMVYMRPGGDVDAPGRFGRFEPVFRLIGNSLVLNDRYK